MAVLFPLGCAHTPASSPDKSERICVTLEDVSLLDALRMSRRKPVSNFGFTQDSLSSQEMKNIRVTVHMTDTTLPKYWEELARQAGLTIEEVSYNSFRVLHKKR